jgi:DNA-binding transcriptional ArsR family regulator
MDENREVRRLDARGLKALAHPLRVRMLGTLRNDGPATATRLAQRLGESTGTTSWHLRQLAEHGFIEEDPDRGTKRDRWWRARTRSTQLSVADFAGRPELTGTIVLFLQSVLENDFARAADFLGQGERGEWPDEWLAAANFSSFTLSADPARMEALNDELMAVVERHRAEAPAEDQTVVVQLQAFPRQVHG